MKENISQKSFWISRKTAGFNLCPTDAGKRYWLY